MRKRSLDSFLLPMVLIVAGWIAPGVQAASKVELDARVSATLERLQEHESATVELMQKASGILVFPRVLKAGFGLGGSTGEGSLLVNYQPVQYYRTTSLSIGLQIGGQASSEVVLFMTDDALERFRQSDGWEAGVDGSIALITVGVGGDIDTHNVQSPIIGFIFGNKGLMYELSFEGSKFWRIDKE